MNKEFRILTAIMSMLALVLVSSAFVSRKNAGDDDHAGIRAPEFTTTDSTQWINSDPLKWESLKGKVVFLDVWTYT